MLDVSELDTESHVRLRGRRLVQITNLVMTVLSIAIAVYAYKGSWQVVGLLAVGLVLVAISQFLSRRGSADLSGAVLLASLFATASGLMWVSEGLHDSALLVYPVLLIMAGLLVQRRLFFSLLASMLLFVTILQLSTHHWQLRTNFPPSEGVDMWADVMLILLLSGVSVWIIVNDLHISLETLKVQIARFRESQIQLTYLSQHDPLTGLPNRTMGRDRIVQAIAHAVRDKTGVAMLFVDLDNFKAINDSLGHDIGDDFLKQVAQRLQQSVRESDIVTRHGGDEFVVGLTDVSDIQDVSNIATNVMESLASPFTSGGSEIPTSCSIGVAVYPQDGLDYEELLRRSDIAMYQAKEAGRNTVRFYDAAMNADIQQNVLLVSELRLALARHEFVLHYQPVLDLASGELAGAEALVRWAHASRGLVGPAMFIPASERSGLIVELGEWVLMEACRQMVQWQAQGCRNFYIAVNLSPVQFRRGDIEKVVQRALQHSGLRPEFLELEITESTLVQDTERFMASLRKLKDLGIRISIDDFGTGYSNLSYLQRFEVDKLKVDQSFVKHLHRSPQDRALVNAILQMARSLNLTTTAEGIEDLAARDALMELGCEQGQGYFFARPLPAAEFSVFMASSQV